jgi:hypothetical protein
MNEHLTEREQPEKPGWWPTNEDELLKMAWNLMVDEDCCPCKSDKWCCGSGSCDEIKIKLLKQIREELE